MKQFTLLILLIVATACSNDCTINAQLISDYSAQINELNDKINEATLESVKNGYRSQIRVLEDKISAEANKCD